MVGATLGTVETPEARREFVAHLLDRAKQMYPRRSAMVLAVELTVGNVITKEEGIEYLGVSSSEYRQATIKLRNRLRQAQKHAKHLSPDTEGVDRHAGHSGRQYAGA